MMRSSMNANSSYEEDDFAPNPFRSSTSSDLLDNTPRQQQQPQFHDPFQTPQMYTTQPPPPTPQMYAQQPPPPQMMMQQPAGAGTYPQPVPTNPVHYLSGQMDTGGAARPEQNREGLTAPAPAAGLFGWLLSCIRLDQASKLFDVDADDVALRLRYSLTQFFRPDYFRTTVLGDGSSGGTTDTTSADGRSTGNKGPDLYGPFWVSMTLIFILGVASNLSDYLHYQRKSDPDSQFEYDITHVRIDTVHARERAKADTAFLHETNLVVAFLLASRRCCTPCTLSLPFRLASPRASSGPCGCAATAIPWRPF
jgi:hypothetical protein